MIVWPKYPGWSRRKYSLYSSPPHKAEFFYRLVTQPPFAWYNGLNCPKNFFLGPLFFFWGGGKLDKSKFPSPFLDDRQAKREKLFSSTFALCKCRLGVWHLFFGSVFLEKTCFLGGTLSVITILLLLNCWIQKACASFGLLMSSIVVKHGPGLTHLCDLERPIAGRWNLADPWAGLTTRLFLGYFHSPTFVQFLNT